MTEGTQMLKNPKETSPTLLSFLSVFHNIAANLHSRNTYHSLSLFSREVWGERVRERETAQNTRKRIVGSESQGDSGTIFVWIGTVE